VYLQLVYDFDIRSKCACCGLCFVFKFVVWFDNTTARALSIKTSAARGEGVCLVRTFCGQGGFFRCGHLHFLVQKLRIFRTLWFVRTDKGNYSHVFYGLPLCEKSTNLVARISNILSKK